MPRIVFFDIETRKHADQLRPDDIDAGWDALRRGEGGISALCIYDTQYKWLYMYDDAKLSLAAAAKHLEEADVVVGYNSILFDIPCIEGKLNRNLRIKTHIDIYTELVQGNSTRGNRLSKGDLQLDTVCRRNLGRGKINHGAHAPALVANGQFGELFNYCSDDVHLTYDLFKYICTHDGVHNVNRGWLPLTIPDWIKKEMVQE